LFFPHIDRIRPEADNESMSDKSDQLVQAIQQLAAGQDRLETAIDQLTKGQEELRTGFNGLKEGQEELRTGFNGLKEGQEELRTGFNGLKEGQETIQRDVRRLEVLYEEMNEKIDQIIEVVSPEMVKNNEQDDKLANHETRITKLELATQ
jgi:uncharacterized phage infection (PIP) family protein YhgE